MKRIFWILIIFCTTTIVNANEIDSNIFFNKTYNITKNTKFVVMPFNCTANWVGRPGEEASKKSIENKNMEKMEIALLNADVIIVERQRIEKILEEQSISISGITEQKSIRIGKLLAANVVILGLIPEWTFWDKENKGCLEIILKGIDVESGAIIFKASFLSSFNTKSGMFRYDIAKIENDAYKILSEKISAQIKKKNNN